MKVKSNIGLIAIAAVLIIGAPSFMHAMHDTHDISDSKHVSGVVTEHDLAARVNTNDPNPNDPTVQVNTNYQITDTTVNMVTPPGSRVGVGVLVPTVMVDTRSDNTVTGDPGFTYSGWRNSQTAVGEREQIIRQRGTMASPTTTLVTDGIYRHDIYGVNTGNTLSQGGEQDCDQDQAAGAAAVPMAFTFKAHNTAGSLKSIMHLDSAQHWNAPTSTAPALSSCGGSPTIAGSDTAGTVTVGTAITGCVITFNTAWNVTNPSFTPHCTVTSRTAAVPFGYAVSTTAITLSTVVAGQIYDYMCIGAS